MEVITVSKAAELLKVNAKTVYRLVERSELPAFKVGRQWRMRLSDVEAWIDRQLRIREAGAAYETRQIDLFTPSDDSSPESRYGKAAFRDSAFSENNALPVHRWVPWIAGFSAKFIDDVLDRYAPTRGDDAYTVLDPFSGVGTTLLAAMLRGCDACGFEINPYAAEACKVKLAIDRIPADELEHSVAEFRESVTNAIAGGEAPRSTRPSGFVTREKFFSPPVERKVLLVQDFVESLRDQQVKQCFRLALASEFVGFSNYSYEPSLGTKAAAGKANVADAAVVAILARKLGIMLQDLRAAQERLFAMPRRPQVSFYTGDFFQLQNVVEDSSIDLVVTSPPYLNNYHYIRNSRPQLYWLGLASSPRDLKDVEERSFGKYWQTVRGEQPVHLQFPMPELQRTIHALQGRNRDKGQYGGPGWANYAATYFNDSFRFAQSLRRVLKPGASAVVVLGNSILQGIEFKTDVFFGEICRSCGLELVEIQMLRKKRTGNSIIKSSVRAAEASRKTTLYESAVIVSK